MGDFSSTPILRPRRGINPLHTPPPPPRDNFGFYFSNYSFPSGRCFCFIDVDVTFKLATKIITSRTTDVEHEKAIKSRLMPHLLRTYVRRNYIEPPIIRADLLAATYLNEDSFAVALSLNDTYLKVYFPYRYRLSIRKKWPK